MNGVVELPVLRRDSRNTLCGRDDTSIGAVPAYAEKRSAVVNRVVSPVMATTVAAMTGPTPKVFVVDVPQASTRACPLTVTADRGRRSEPLAMTGGPPETTACHTVLAGYGVGSGYPPP